jgi:hypothetical protein
MTFREPTVNLFTGRWVGETQGCAMPTHIWEISQQNSKLLLATRWEGQTKVVRFYARIVPDEPAFAIQGNRPVKAILIDQQHFVIPGWCTNDARDGRGPGYDVVFSRPGIAELTARRAYARYLEMLQQEGDYDSPTSRTTSPKGN